MRILVAHNVSSSRTGGMSRIMAFTHEPLRERGHHIDYIHAEDLPPGQHGLISRFTFPWLVRRRVREAALRGAPYDIVNVHEPVGAWVAWARSGSEATRVVVTSHGVEQRAWELNLAGRLGGPPPTLRTRLAHPATTLWFSRIALRRADHLFCLNSEDREFLIQRFGRRPGDITRIFPGASQLYSRASADRDYRRISTVLFAGTWLPRKGTGPLREAFAAVAANHPQVRLVVLGGGVAPEHVLASFPDPLRDRVRVVHSITEEGNAASFAAADLLVLPSLFEGTPLTLIEAMMSGLPIVTTDTCGMRDVIQNHKNGLLVEPGSASALASALLEVLSSAELRQRLGTNARADALAQYTWSHSAERVRAAYLALTGEQTLPGART